MKMKYWFTVLVSGIGSLLAAANLLIAPEGSLRCDRAGDGITVEIRNGLVNLTLEGAERQLGFSLPIEPDAKLVRLSGRMQVEGVRRGKANWQDGRMAMRFYDRQGKAVGEWPRVFSASGTSGWLDCDRLYQVPEGAATLRFTPANFGTAGKVKIRNLRLEALRFPAEANMDAPPPDGSDQEALFTLDDAQKLTTPTRERICLNGLWSFRPVFHGESPARFPADGSGWGYFKVPGSWPSYPNGMKFYLSSLALHKLDAANLNSAWYRRTITVPASWKGRRILLNADLIQSCAKVFVDGTEAGELYYPGGELDLSGRLIPGQKHTVSLLVSARPEVLTTFMAQNRLITEKGQLQNRGITGDLYLESRPMMAAVADVHVITSVKHREITFDTGFADLPAGRYRLEAEITAGNKVVKCFTSEPFRTEGGKNFRHRFSGKWNDPLLWDTDTPENLYTAKLRLLTGHDELLDAFLPQEFGFREFSVNGRDFYLNGRKIHLRMLVTRAPQEPDFASPGRIGHLVKSARQFGVNCLIGWNYSFAPGIFSYPDGFHKLTSKQGMLTTLTLPHVKDFKTNLSDPAQAESYRRQAEHLIRRYWNVPGVVMFVMNHNAMGYSGDQNPERLGTAYRPEDAVVPGTFPGRAQAMLAEKLVKSLDSSRPVYHHQSGNLGDVYTLNCYLNWAPRQERSDWLEHWEKYGTMPVMFVEWGIPHVASWSSYRGPAFIWRSPGVQCIWVNEFNAAILGEEAYRSEPAKTSYYELQEKLVKGNRPVLFHTLGGNGPLNRIADVNRVRNYYARRNFRDMRARGISGILPWDQFTFWEWEGRRAGIGDNPERFHNLKRPGIVPDELLNRGEHINNPFGSYRLSQTGLPIAENFTEYLGWIAGKIGEFTENSHQFRPGETVDKSLMLLNDSRRDADIRWEWRVPSLHLKQNGSVSVAPGERGEVPVSFTIPADFSGKPVLEADISFPDGSNRQDRLELTVLPPESPRINSVVGLFDPDGSAAALLERGKIGFRTVKSDADLAGVELLILGRRALDRLPLHLSGRLKAGLKLMVLEQSIGSLNRLGLRGTEQGYREVFPLNDEYAVARDWRGSATLLPPYLEVPAFEATNPKWNWNGFDNTRVWRAGNRGCVTQVPLEKPAIGNWNPLLQCGFDLQYTPLAEFREGKGRILFCQLAATGRTECEPQAEDFFLKALSRLDRAEIPPERIVFYAGAPEGEALLASLKVPFHAYAGKLPENALLVLGPGAKVPRLSNAVEAGANVLALGLGATELEAVLPGVFQLESGNFVSDYAAGLRDYPEFTGVGQAELHWRGKMQFDGFPATNPGGRALAVHRIGRGSFVAMQLPAWKFDGKEFYNRTTLRRTTFLASRLLANLGAPSDTGLFDLLDGVKGNLSLPLPNDQWLGIPDPGKTGHNSGWFRSDFTPDKSWRKVSVPGTFQSQFAKLTNYHGYFWYRLEFNLPENLPADDYELFIGAVDDESWVWLNDNFLGEITAGNRPDDYWQFSRDFKLKPGSLKAGRNVLVVLCNDLRDTGGILGIPSLKTQNRYNFYTDKPEAADDPYRYYRW